MSIHENSLRDVDSRTYIGVWNQTEFEVYWIKILGDDYTAIPEVIRDFYRRAFIEIDEAEDEQRLGQIVVDYAPLLDADSRMTIPFLVGLIPAHRAMAYKAFLEVSGSIEKPNRHMHLDWIKPEIDIEPNPEKRIWAADTVYQFIKDNSDPKESRRNRRVAIGSQQILYYLVGMLETGAIRNQMINNLKLREHVEHSYNNSDKFLAFMYAVSEVIPRFPDEREDIYKSRMGALQFIKDNMPDGYTYAQMEERYPIVFEWLARVSGV